MTDHAADQPAPTSPASSAGAPPAASPLWSSVAPLPVPPLRTVARPPEAEAVARGLLFSLAAIPVGVVLSVLVWRAGFVASISSFAMGALAAFLYRRGAGRVGRAGVAVVAGVVLVGVVVSFAGIVASDLMEVYAAHRAEIEGSEATFVTSGLTDGAVLGAYGRDLAIFAFFAVLGAVATGRRVGRSVAR